MRELWATRNPRELWVEESWAPEEQGVGKAGQRDKRSPRKRWGRVLDVLLLRIGAWNRQETTEVRNSPAAVKFKGILQPLPSE